MATSNEGKAWKHKQRNCNRRDTNKLITKVKTMQITRIKKKTYKNKTITFS